MFYSYVNKYWPKVIKTWPLLILLSMAVIVVINIGSLIGYLYFLFLTILLYYLIFKSFDQEVLFLFGLYSLLIITLYLIQFLIIPEYYGFSGGEGIGTDDSFYYSQVAMQLPTGFPKRVNYLGRGLNTYSKVLKFIAPYSIRHPFDIIFFNCLGTAFLPVFTREFTISFLKSKKAAWGGFLFSAICPFLLSNSLILVRDGWTATLFIGSMYFLFRKKYLFLIGSVLLLFYMRISSGGLALGALGVLAIIRFSEASVSKHFKPVLFMAIVGVLIIISFFAVPIIYDYLVSKGIAGVIIREDFIRQMYTGKDVNPLYKALLLQPAFIRIPIATAFYSVLPLFSPDNIFNKGIFIPRHFMQSVLYPLLFTAFYFRYLIRGFIDSIRNNTKRVILIWGLFIFFMMIISQLSMQPRHKTMLMPLMYVLAGHGFAVDNKSGRKFISILTALFIVAQLVVLVL